MEAERTVRQEAIDELEMTQNQNVKQLADACQAIADLQTQKDTLIQQVFSCMQTKQTNKKRRNFNLQTAFCFTSSWTMLPLALRACKQWSRRSVA